MNACVESARSSRRPDSRALFFDELDQLAPDALIFVRRADVQARQFALVFLRIDVQGDAADRIPIDLEDEVVAERPSRDRSCCA